MNIEQIRELARIANENHLESIELECEGMTVKIKMAVGGYVEASSQEKIVQRTYQVTHQASAESAAETSVQPANPFHHDFKSPMVGVYYAAPSPDKEPYVRVGSRVKKGDILCIIEAMKLMNEITADRDGEILQICVENGQVVEYAQLLFQIA